MDRQLQGTDSCAVVGRMGSAEAEGVPVTAPAAFRWFEEARFGLFVHWGLYSMLGGEWRGRTCPGVAEQIMRSLRIPAAEYARLAGDFNPVCFDADAWVSLARQAGMRYIVITAKHHDGFAMFRSRHPFNIVDATPFGRDPMEELAAACERHGLTLCFYYSHARDWFERDSVSNYPNNWDFAPGTVRDPDRYLEGKALPQVRELLTQYGRVGMMWFDTPVLMTREQSLSFVRLVKSIQPDCLVNQRVGNNLGDIGGLGDNQAPSGRATAPCETCATMNDTWGYKRADSNWKPASDLIRMLSELAGKGCNYLLNVGPKGDGSIPEESVLRLRQVGAWMDRNGEAIHGSAPGPWPGDLPGLTVTHKPGRLYLMLHQWPAGRALCLRGLRNQVNDAVLVGEGDRDLLVTQQRDDALDLDELTLSGLGDAPQTPVPVIRLGIVGEPDVDRMPVQFPDGGIHLPAFLATVRPPSRGRAAVVGSSGATEGWTNAQNRLTWRFKVATPGRFLVQTVTAGCHRTWDQEGHRLRIDVHGTKLTTTTRPQHPCPGPRTVYWPEFATDAGPVTIREPGVHSLTLRAERICKDTPRGVVLAAVRLVLLSAMLVACVLVAMPLRGDDESIWRQYDVYQPSVDHTTVVDGDVDPLKYSHGSTVGRLGDHWVCLWNANTVPIEGQPGQLIAMSTSRDGQTWTQPEPAFADAVRSVNPAPCPTGVQWQPNVIAVDNELWAFWSQLARDDHYGCYLSRLSEPTGKWVNRRLLWDGRPDPVVDGKPWRVLPLANPVRLRSGRLLVPVTLLGKRADDAPVELSQWMARAKRSSVLYSDDQGATWQVSSGAVQPARTWAQWEPTVWEKADGTVMMFARNQAAEPDQDTVSLLWSKSRDGGVTWTPHLPVPLQTTASRMHVLALPGDRFAMVHSDWPAGLTRNRRCNLAVFFNRGGGIDFAPGPGISGFEPLVMYPNAWLDEDGLRVSYSAGFPPRVIRVARIHPLPDPNRFYLLPRLNVHPPDSPVRVRNYLRFAGHESLRALQAPDLGAEGFSLGAWVRSTGTTLLDTRQSEPKAGFVWALKEVRPVLSILGVRGELSPKLRLRWHEWNYVGLTVDARTGEAVFTVNAESESVRFEPGGLPLCGRVAKVGDVTLEGSSLKGFRGHLRMLAAYAGPVLDASGHAALMRRFAEGLGVTVAPGAPASDLPSVPPVLWLDAADPASYTAFAWAPDVERGVSVAQDGDGRILRFAGEASAGIELDANDREAGDRVELRFRFRCPIGDRHTVCTAGDANQPARVCVKNGRVRLQTADAEHDAGPLKTDVWNEAAVETAAETTTLRLNDGDPVSVSHRPQATWMMLGEGYPPNGIPDGNRLEIDVESVRTRVTAASEGTVEQKR
jgi:alpha-L-fucosidase